LFEGAQQAKGTRASFGGIWGGFEQLSWPVGNADVRVLCGEASALTFNRGGIHTTIGDFAATGEGDFSFRLLAAGVPQRGDHELTVVVTAPFFDISEKPLSRERAGERTLLQRDHDYRTFPHRRDTVTIRGLHHNDTVIIGSAPPGPGITPQLVKPRRLSPAPTTKMGHFTLLNLAPIADMEVPTDWSDPQSLAGLPRGRRVVYGIPFELVDPDLNHGKAAVEKAEIVLDQGGKTLLLLARAEDDEQGLIRVTLADGTERTVSAKGVPVLNGWPPLFEWTLDLVRVPLGGLRAKVKAENAAIFAVTVASEKADLRPTQTALQVKQQEAEARRRTIAGLRELAQLFDHFTGHLAVLPVARTESARSSPLVKMFRQAGAYDALTFLTAEQLVDPNYFNAERFWVALYLGSEVYQNSVREQGDVIASLQRYLREGGTLVVLPSGPFPFYYDETGKVTIRAAEVGLPINGSGFEGRRDRLPAAERLNITGWERPPEGKQFTFHLRPDQSIITSLPKQFPFPKTGDLRWRPVANIIDDLGTYTPLLTLYDQTGSSYGEGAAMIEYHQGPLAGGRVVYVWTTLVHSQEYQAPLVTDLMRHLLNNIVPPPARALCYRASSPIVIDGKLDEPAWQNVTPLDKFGCFLTKRGHPTYPTRAKVLWDDENLYVGFEAEDPDIWSEHTQRDGPLWEGEVCEVYVDPDSDGREYLEFEVNPLNTVIDLKIPREEDGTPLQVSVATKWNAEGWRTAVAVEGEVQNRTDRDRSWSVEMAIPLTNFAPLGGPPPKVGDTWRLQLYRIDRSNTLKEPEFSSWSPTDTFHRPSQFGRLTFAGPPNTDDFSLYSPGSSGAPFWRLTAGTWEVVEGVFRGRDCLISGWLPSGAVMEQTVVENFVLRLRFQIVSRGSDWRDGPWIGFRYNGPESAYSLNFGSQDVSLHKAYGGLSTNDDANLGSVSWHPDDSWHTVEIVMNGAEIAVRLDDSPLLAARDANTLGVGLVPPGNICLAARRWGNSVGHTEILFDDIAIEKHD
ncbi:MAG: carbohydrate-binding family 9-like protein, partial [Candidatus Zipacnadales bacterium]